MGRVDHTRIEMGRVDHTRVEGVFGYLVVHGNESTTKHQNLLV